MMNPLHQLMACEQSYWMDNLTRHMILSGSLKKQVSEQQLRGVTSNPAIVHKAVTGSDDYETQIAQLVKEGCNSNDIYERLVITDVQYACDILRPIYDACDGADGFVSLEVSPYLAHDTDGSAQEARRLWAAVDRPNLLIKIPGTEAGVPAIEQALIEGINVNITLLFSIQDYEAVAHAYVRALEQRHAAGKPLNRIASVASFFLSRIDVLVDQLLCHRVRPSALGSEPMLVHQLYGKVAIANARLAYQSFKRIFSGARWQALEAAGARVQRPLWASTGTKSPLYSDVMYVEPLIGPHTVNTMTEETIAAFADHGKVVANTIEADVEEAQWILYQALPQVGITLDRVTWQLQNEGIQKFIDPFDTLMRTLADKTNDPQAFLGDPMPSPR
jgi:transaldolase